jgi:dihydropteroate synthase
MSILESTKVEEPPARTRASARPLIMGIVNVTPDSFSDGGRHSAPDAAIALGRRMVAEGADLLDIGGESTRPGSRPVSSEMQWQRIGPVVLELAQVGVPLSIDTRSAEVADLALDAGARIINDVSAGTYDSRMLPLLARRGAHVVLMHMQGTPETMQQNPRYGDCVAEVREFLLLRTLAALRAGIHRENIWIDPGIGFGKTLEHNLALLAGLEHFTQTGYPVLLGLSRKSFVSQIAGGAPDERLGGSLAALIPALEAGVHAVRVHDVRDTCQFFAVAARVGRA